MEALLTKGLKGPFFPFPLCWGEFFSSMGPGQRLMFLLLPLHSCLECLTSELISWMENSKSMLEQEGTLLSYPTPAFYQYGS